MSITKSEWERLETLDSKKLWSEVANREIDDYLEKGGKITRREKSGALTFWVKDENGSLKRVLPKVSL